MQSAYNGYYVKQNRASISLARLSPTLWGHSIAGLFLSEMELFIGVGSAGKPFFDLRAFFITFFVKNVHFLQIQFQGLHVKSGFGGDDEGVVVGQYAAQLTVVGFGPLGKGPGQGGIFSPEA